MLITLTWNAVLAKVPDRISWRRRNDQTPAFDEGQCRCHAQTERDQIGNNRAWNGDLEIIWIPSVCCGTYVHCMDVTVQWRHSFHDRNTGIIPIGQSRVQCWCIHKNTDAFEFTKTNVIIFRAMKTWHLAIYPEIIVRLKNITEWNMKWRSGEWDEHRMDAEHLTRWRSLCHPSQLWFVTPLID